MAAGGLRVCSLKSNRLAFMRKGGLHHIAYLARTTVGDTKSGNGQKLVRAPVGCPWHCWRLRVHGLTRELTSQILFAAKTMYQLSCADECAKRLFFFSGFKDLWLTFARHPTQDIRQRAAGVFNKVVEQKIGCVRQPSACARLRCVVLVCPHAIRAHATCRGWRLQLPYDPLRLVSVPGGGAAPRGHGERLEQQRDASAEEGPEHRQLPGVARACRLVDPYL